MAGASSAPPAATSERLASGIPIFAPFAATIRSHASAISIPPATAKPSIAAISGLRDARWAMPAKPRSPNHGDSPLTNAPRSIPALKKPPAPVSTPTDRPSSESSSSSAPATPSATAPLTALRTSGRLSVINRMLPRRSVSTTSESFMAASYAANRVRSGSRSPRSTARSTSTQSIPRACASTRACGLMTCAASTPRQESMAGSRRIRSR